MAPPSVHKFGINGKGTTHAPQIWRRFGKLPGTTIRKSFVKILSTNLPGVNELFCKNESTVGQFIYSSFHLYQRNVYFLEPSSLKTHRTQTLFPALPVRDELSVTRCLQELAGRALLLGQAMAANCSIESISGCSSEEISLLVHNLNVPGKFTNIFLRLYSYSY